MVVTVSHSAEYLPYDLEITGLNPAQAPKSPDIHLNFFKFCRNTIKILLENDLDFQTVNLN